MLGFHFHSAFDFGDADPDIGLAVHHHQAGRAVTYGAEKSPGTMQFLALCQFLNPRSMQGGRYGFGGITINVLSVEKKVYLIPPAEI